MWWQTALKGAAIGVANIIPGVSGGTLALLLGLYERLIKTLANLKPARLFIALRSVKSFRSYWKEQDLSFLFWLGCGAVLAIILFSKLIKLLLSHALEPTYGLFFGLVLASIPLPWRLIKQRNLATFLATLAGTACVLAASLGVSPETQLDAARKRQLMKQEQQVNKLEGIERAQIPVAAGVAVAPGIEQNQGQIIGQVKGQGRETPDSPIKASDTTPSLAYAARMAGAGAIAISAMILPGLSGAFILLLLGMYFEVLTAIGQFQLAALCTFALGCGLGLLVFTRALNWLLDRAHDVTMGFLTGLVCGSLYALWPFRSYTVIDSKPILTAHLWPDLTHSLHLGAIAAMCAGVVLVLALDRLQPATAKESPAQPSS